MADTLCSMRGLIVVMALVAITVGGCSRAALPSQYPPPDPTAYQYPPPDAAPYQYPRPGAAIMPAPAPQPLYAAAPQGSPWQGCAQQQATELVQTRQAKVNDPCVLHWRSIEVQQHPERATDLECAGLKAYEDPQPPGHPIPLTECDRITREGQQRFGLPVRGLSEELKAAYRATWGAMPPTPQSQPDVPEPASNATCFTGPGLPLCVPADQIWHKSATEWYNPSTYCKWGRQQLPERLQKVCSELDQKYPPRKANWKRMEADNGAAYAVDLNSIAHRDNGTAEMQVCIVDNNTCAIMPGTWNPTIFQFDCHGHYMDVYGGGGLQMAPPRSVVGQMAALACTGATVR